jgi:UDP-N-acetylglucosamine--N-acetylmuramyl-(pentapeptide) pyrophosphoryl-undecaprenol N-acetylglucosamine transferase
MTGGVLIMAGGTGGHVFPALAVAERLRGEGVEVVWMGTRRGLEAQVVPNAGIPIEWVSIGGLRGKGALGWLAAPFRLGGALAQALAILVRRRPIAVLGMGGFVAGPGGVAAYLLRRPLLIHEQNAVAGLTNRLLARLASRALEAFPGALGGRAVHTGNPVRPEIAALTSPEQRMTGRTGRVRLLVLGGSLGARALNALVPQALRAMAAERRPEVRHQAGTRNLEEALRGYREAGVEAEVVPFITDMAEAYGWADLVVCRAGALTVAELAAAGVGAILVPFPYAVDDHQTHNAAYLVEGGAARLVQERELTPAALAAMLEALVDRARLLEMATAARRLARPDAAQRVAELCLEAGRARGPARRSAL